MKKFIQLLLLFIAFNGYSQKRLTILNYCSSSQKVYKIQTKPATGTYPFCYNGNGALGFNSGDTCYLVNLGSSTKFPFKTTSPVTYISPVTTWRRQVNATTIQNLSNNTIWNLTSSTNQEFDYATIVGGTLSPANPEIIFGTAGNGGWRADYERVYYVFPNDYEDFIIFTDL